MNDNPGLHGFDGNCHCGRFQFTINVPSLTSVSECSCVICTKNGYLWTPLPSQRDIIVRKGEEGLSAYKFGEKSMSHLFCPECGSSVLARNSDGLDQENLFVNARMLQGVDLESIHVRKFACPDAAIEPIQVTYPELSHVEDGLKVYNGNCFCGAITYAVKTEPLLKQKVMSCNCSLCARNSDLWIYPSKSAVALHGSDKLTGYIFLAEDSLHSFCSVCGVSMIVKVTDEKEDVMPVNVRAIERVEVPSLDLQKYNGRGNGPEYIMRH